MKKYVVLNKAVGETPLEALERFRQTDTELKNIPMAYAGRLDPMASGKLLVLVGEECRQQEQYHGLDKEYIVEMLFGVSSDSGDVLGLVEEVGPPQFGRSKVRKALRSLIGTIELPYPIFSSKTVDGKPLHTWTMEGRLDEIEIPTYQARVYQLRLLSLLKKTRECIYNEASMKIETIPPVTDSRKALGNDFRRPDVRRAWSHFKDQGNPHDEFLIGTVECIAGTGTYMRTLSDEVAKRLGTRGLAYSIHRTKIGKFGSLPLGFGLWTTLYK